LFFSRLKKTTKNPPKKAGENLPFSTPLFKSRFFEIKLRSASQISETKKISKLPLRFFFGLKELRCRPRQEKKKRGLHPNYFIYSYLFNPDSI